MVGQNKHSVLANETNPANDADQPSDYQIRIKGHLSLQWTDWFEGLVITQEENGDTLLTGPVVDQAALHGLIRKVRDLGLPLLSVNIIRAGHADVPESPAG